MISDLSPLYIDLKEFLIGQVVERPKAIALLTLGEPQLSLKGPELWSFDGALAEGGVGL